MRSVVDRNVVVRLVTMSKDNIVNITLIYVYVTLLMRVRKAFAESNYYLCHVCPSVCLDETLRLTPDGFSSYLVLYGYLLTSLGTHILHQDLSTF